jgi:hypothetical protein
MPKFSEKFNKAAFNVDTTDFEYCKLKDLWDATAATENRPQPVYRLDAVYVNKSQLGDSPLAICAEIGKMVNLPTHTAATCREIIADADAVNDIKDGKVGFTIYEYTAKGKTCYGVKWVDIEPNANTAETAENKAKDAKK